MNTFKTISFYSIINRCFKFFIIPLLTFFVYTIKAQNAEDSSKFKIWINDGLGYSLTTPQAFTLGANINCLYNKLSYNIGINLTGYPQLTDFISSYYLGLGKTLKKKSIMTSVFLGPSFFIGNKEFKEYKTYGIASNIQFIFLPINRIGIGMEIFGNINSTQSNIGIKGILHISN